MRRIPALILALLCLCWTQAKADTFTAYSYFDGNSYTPIGLDDSGDVLIFSSAFSNYTVWNAGVELYDASVPPSSFVADNGTACTSPTGGMAFCNGDRLVYSTDGRDAYEIYPGSPAMGTLLQDSLVGSVDGHVLINSVGDVAFVDGRDEVQREIINTTTPEPSSLVLLATGALGTLAAARRRLQQLG